MKKLVCWFQVLDFYQVTFFIFQIFQLITSHHSTNYFFSIFTSWKFEVWDLKKIDFFTKLKSIPFWTIMCTISICWLFNVFSPKFQCWTTYFIVFDAVVLHCSCNNRNICIFLEFWHLWIFCPTVINKFFILVIVVIMLFRYKYQNW